MLVPLKNLHPGGDINSRNTPADQLEIDGLAHSIRAFGLILPLSVVKNGKGYKVIDGNRRLMALQLIHEGEKNVEIPVLVQDIDDATALGMSLAANVERLPLHPVEQYECFARLGETGKSLADIAAAFGIGERQVRQQMALGSLAPEVRTAYRAGDIDARLAKALTRVTHDEQLRLITSGEHGWTILKQLDEMFKTDSYHPSSPMCRFVTRETYAEAGGTFVQDLFVEEKDQLWSDPGLVGELANTKLNELRKTVLADGWSFFEMIDTYWSQEFMREDEAGEPIGMDAQDLLRIEQIEGRMAEIHLEIGDDEDDENHNDLVVEMRDLEGEETEILDQYRSFTDEQKGRLGVVVDNGYTVTYGVKRRAGAKKPEETKPAEKSEQAQSTAVMMDLDGHLTNAVRGALVDQPGIAVRLLALSFLCNYFISDKLSTVWDGVGIKADMSGNTIAATDYGLDNILAMVKSVKLEKAKTFEQRMGCMLKLDDAEIHYIITFMVARSLQTRHRNSDLVLYLDKHKHLKIRDHFTPDADNFFGRLTKAQLKMIAEEEGIKWDALNWDTLKKGELVAAVAKTVAADWIPEAMRPKKAD